MKAEDTKAKIRQLRERKNVNSVLFKYCTY